MAAKTTYALLHCQERPKTDDRSDEIQLLENAFPIRGRPPIPRCRFIARDSPSAVLFPALALRSAAADSNPSPCLHSPPGRATFALW